MDEKRDLQRQDHLSNLLDGQVIQTNPFGRNASAERAYRRSERLVAALHILTNHVPPEEPLRSTSRQISIRLLSDVLALRDDMRVSSSPAFRRVQTSVRELISLVRILSVSGYISPQNANVLVEALDELGNFLESSQRSSLSGSVTFSKDELLGADHISSRRSSAQRQSSRTRGEDAAQSLKDISHQTDTPGKKEKTLPTNDVLDRRSQAVLDVLKSQDAIGIKDISANLPEYSEKMIQRELARLVTLGRIKKMGFKRWSRYSLAR